MQQYYEESIQKNLLSIQIDKYEKSSDPGCSPLVDKLKKLTRAVLAANLCASLSMVAMNVIIVEFNLTS